MFKFVLKMPKTFLSRKKHLKFKDKKLQVTNVVFLKVYLAQFGNYKASQLSIV